MIATNESCLGGYGGTLSLCGPVKLPELPFQCAIGTSVRWLKGCKQKIRVFSISSEGLQETINIVFVRRPPRYMVPHCPVVGSPMPTGCPPDPGRGRHWDRKAG